MCISVYLSWLGDCVNSGPIAMLSYYSERLSPGVVAPTVIEHHRLSRRRLWKQNVSSPLTRGHSVCVVKRRRRTNCPFVNIQLSYLTITSVAPHSFMSQIRNPDRKQFGSSHEWDLSHRWLKIGPTSETLSRLWVNGEPARDAIYIYIAFCSLFRCMADKKG